jgi:hypothetical protein
MIEYVSWVTYKCANVSKAAYNINQVFYVLLTVLHIMIVVK